jgi:AcrR family transcriptional regulator
LNKISTKKRLYRSNLIEAEVDIIQNKVLVEERRDQILDAAQDLFMEKGFAATTVRDICSKSGINQASIYDYVLNKQDILRRLLNRVWFRISPRLEDLLAEGSGRPFKSILRDYYKICWGEKRNGTILAYRTVPHLDNEDRKLLRKHEKNMIKSLSDYLRNEYRLKISDKRVEVLANYIIFTNSFAPMRDWLNTDISNDLVLDTIVDSILAMLEKLIKD